MIDTTPCPVCNTTDCTRHTNPTPKPDLVEEVLEYEIPPASAEEWGDSIKTLAQRIKEALDIFRDDSIDPDDLAHRMASKLEGFGGRDDE